MPAAPIPPRRALRLVQRLTRSVPSVARAALSPGGGAHFRVPRVPRLLFPRLDERGLRHAFHEQLDGSALLAVWAPA